MIDHVAVCVDTINEEPLDRFMLALGFLPFDIPEDAPQAAYEARHEQRWYSNGGECDVHVVQCPDLESCHLYETKWGWGHFCVVVDWEAYSELRDHPACVRDNDTGRIWLEYSNLRVEVRNGGDV